MEILMKVIRIVINKAAMILGKGCPTLLVQKTTSNSIWKNWDRRYNASILW